MPEDFKYWIICKTDRTKKFYQDKAAGDLWAGLVLANMEGRHSFGQGDALIVRDELQAAGFRWGVDFYLRKEEVE
jgi:hypothetical protein